jgi:TetR/AcrR family transcriptional regulator, lmrAB and yxaGH operons repressor
MVVSDAKSRMVDGAVRLLATRGLQSTSFTEVLAATGAPRGSIYHHFPEGKDEMVAAALDVAAGRLQNLLDDMRGESPERVTERFLEAWRTVLTRSDLRAGCAVLAVTVATDSPDLLAQSAEIFRAWRGQLSELLRSGGVAQDVAERFAATLVAASEGAVVLSRAEKSMEPFEAVAAWLTDSARSL